MGFELPVHCKFLVGLTLLMWMVFFALLLRSVIFRVAQFLRQSKQ